jgi:ATP-dependent Clp protease ATP-binding subunit ClpA
MHSGIRSWKNLVTYAFNAFSIPLLLKTLFSPWERDRGEGSNFDFLEKIVFAIFARFLGFVARITFISLGLIFTILMILTFPIFFFIPINLKKENMANWDSFGSFLSYGNTFTLNKHSRDLLSPSRVKIFGKEKALRMIERGLSKDTNHNVLLVGETGVGKSTLTQYLGRLGQSALSFHGIRNHRVVELRVEGISLEDFETSMEEARSAGNVVVVIENIHGYEILYERLAHYLNSKELGIIATTDFANFDQVLKSHPEFLVKFEKVEVDPTSAEDTLAILYNTASIYGTSIKKDVLLEIVELSERMIHNQPQPLKSLLLLEELRSLGKKITIDDVRSVVSDKTNMPIGLIGKEEREILLDLEKNMREKIVGQDEAVKDVTEALKRLRTGIADPSKPAGTFLFLGPTGVGKTYTAKILAESYFGRRDAMVRFDMSEFSQEESLSLFSDRLASVMEENPLSLVFFDELEKSHRSIQHLLLQVLDEGKLTRENGRVATFTDSIIIATSNAGSKNIVGDPMIDKKTLIYFLIHDGIFAPEFLNRFSSIVLFKPLSASQVKIVAELMLNEFTERLLEEKGIKVVITPALIEKIAEAGFDPEFGARPIKRAIEEIVENKVAEYILAGKGAGEFKIL